MYTAQSFIHANMPAGRTLWVRTPLSLLCFQQVIFSGMPRHALTRSICHGPSSF